MASNTAPAADDDELVQSFGPLLHVYKSGRLERPVMAPPVAPGLDPATGVDSKDVDLGDYSARLYLPPAAATASTKLPVIVYIHGGGFVAESAKSPNYHRFLNDLASACPAIGVSVDYRLAPEHRLPAAFDDGLAAVRWLRQQAASCRNNDDLSWWRGRCRFDSVFLMGDSAGATIAFHVAARLGQGHLGASLGPLCVRGAILVQPFFGGEARTASEKTMAQPPRSALSLSTSDSYWRMALPAGAGRDHPWCNPLSSSSSRGAPRLDTLPLPPVLVCIAEADILRDRNLELCKALRKAGKSVEQAMYGGVGHAFQVLHNYHLSQPRTQEMLAHIKAFVSARSS